MLLSHPYWARLYTLAENVHEAPLLLKIASTSPRYVDRWGIIANKTKAGSIELPLAKDFRYTWI